MKLIFYIAFLLLFYIWIGYFAVVFILSKIIRLKRTYDDFYQPFVTIIIAAFNEADVIENRIKNLLQLNYPKNSIEILIGSDGSTDETVSVANRFRKNGVKVVDFPENKGRANVHNNLIRIAEGSILIFTDADTVFDTNFINHIVKPFSDPRIGAAVGNLSYIVKGGYIAKSEKLYWRYESKIKQCENALGIINKGSGACMAFRKELYKCLTPRDDIDAATFVDILYQGYNGIFVPEAKAYDIPPHSVESELKLRIRGSSKYLSSISSKLNISLIFKRPIIFICILSHTFLRRFTPYFLLMLFFTNIALLNSYRFYLVIFSIQIIFYLFGIIGWLGNRFKKNIPIASNIFSLLIAFLGMMIGVFKAFTNKVTVTYKMKDDFR